MLQKHFITSIIASVAMIISLIGVPGTVIADDTPYCAKQLDIRVPSKADAKSLTPVILVHGWNGKPDIWTKQPSMSDVISRMDVKVHIFNYQNVNLEWVQRSGADSQLAKTIVCYSKLYNNKKVIIVAHSMGGLLTRAALDWSEYGTYTKDVVGHVVTIATPHKGAPMGNLVSLFSTFPCYGTVFSNPLIGSLLCMANRVDAAAAMSQGSKELAALPSIPSGITVKAIAGHVYYYFCIDGKECKSSDMYGDLVVPVDSALDEYTTTGRGDGKQVFKCYTGNMIPSADGGSCEHSNLIRYQPVQKAVASSITAYLTAVKKAATQPKLPPHSMYDFFSRFTLPFLNTWGAGMSSPDSVLNIVDNTQCNASNADCPHINVVDLTSEYGKEVYGNSMPTSAVAQQFCSTDEQQYDGRFAGLERRIIGSKSVDYYTQLHCVAGPKAPAGVYVWYIPERQLLVVAYDTQQDKIAPDAITAVLSGIEWK